MLPVEGHTGWGADSIVLLRVHSSLVRSKLDYGCVAYGPAHQSVLKQLDPLHHQGLRIALGAFRTSPAQSLHVETHEPSLTSRRLKLSLNYDKFENFMDLIEDGKEIVFVWVPGHVGIRGNSAADAAAKDALVGDTSVELIPFSDGKSRANNYISELWHLL